MKFISVFETMTRTNVKDCFENKNKQLVFIVESGQIGRAIGKNASNVKRIEAMLKKKIRIVEFNEDVSEFIRNLIYPLDVQEITIMDGEMTIAGGDTKTKGLLMGRNLQNLHETQSIVNRYFNIKSIKVI
jgi:transcription termination/antitermination protein NusA